MDKIEQAHQSLLKLGADATAAQVANIIGEMPKADVIQVITKLEFQPRRSNTPDRDEVGAQRWRDAAESDRESGHLTDSMADYYDNEVRACLRDPNTSCGCPQDSANDRLVRVIRQVLDSKKSD
jgi:hypothetical protein